MKFHWRRSLWLLFIYFYSALFFYNFFKPFNNWQAVYIYTMILIIWLGIEYYEKRLFFQSGYLPSKLYPLGLRMLFALFFYSSFIIGNATIVWWHRHRIGLYPLPQVFGIILLLFSIALRWYILNYKEVTKKNISIFYLSVMLLIISLIFGYGAQFLILYTLFIGIPLILWQRAVEYRCFAKFENYIKGKKNVDKIKLKHYEKFWNEYLGANIKRR